MGRAAKSRRIDPRRAKIHHNYTVADIAALFGVHRNTVRNWARSGLETIRVGGQILVLGDALREYLARRQADRRVRCPPGSMFCLKCRDARTPPDGLVEAVRSSATTVNLRGLCPVCGSIMHRQASLGRLAEIGFGHLARHAPASAPS
jgi:excisionase family DNA binding protein